MKSASKRTAANSRTASSRPVKLSELEQELLALLPRSGKPITTHELMAKYWSDEQPFNARGIITTRMNGIMRKLDRMGGELRVAKSPRRGPLPISFYRRPV